MGNPEPTDFVEAEDDPKWAYWNTPDGTGVTRRQRKWAEQVGVTPTLDAIAAPPCLGGSPMDGPCCRAGSCVTCEARRRAR